MFSPGEIIIPVDTHVERRKGEKIRGLGRQRDAVRSTKKRKVLTIGLLWLVASVSVRFPGCPTSWALPFFSQLIPPKRPLTTSRNNHDLSGKFRRKTLTESTIQLINLIKDPSNEVEPVVLFSTNTDHAAERIIEVFVSRWPIEVTFEESRRHLGVETQRQWSDKAIGRTTPCILGSFSITVLMAMRLTRERGDKIPLQDTAWYHKRHITFSDVLAYVRLAVLKKKYYSKFGLKTELGKWT
jgi:hypothetical protein